MTLRVQLEPQRGERRSAPARILGTLRWGLLVVALVTLGYAAYTYLDAGVYQAYENWAFDQELDGRSPSMTGFLKDQARGWMGSRDNSPSRAADAPLVPPAPASAAAETRSSHPRAAKSAHGVRRPEPQHPMLALADKSIIGRIEIPRLRLQAMVREGVDDSTLRRAVGHVPGTAEPGDTGNMGLAGHRDTFFRSLHGVRKNDFIVLETLAAKYKYQVDSLKIVGPDDVKVLDPTKHAILTLITCYPFEYIGHAPRRFIVRARRVGVESREPASKAQAGS